MKVRNKSFEGSPGSIYRYIYVCPENPRFIGFPKNCTAISSIVTWGRRGRGFFGRESTVLFVASLAVKSCNRSGQSPRDDCEATRSGGATNGAVWGQLQYVTVRVRVRVNATPESRMLPVSVGVKYSIVEYR